MSHTVETGLPPHWASAPLEHLLREPLRNGHSARESKDGKGIRTLTLTAVTKADFSETNTKITVADSKKVAHLWLESGDILIERSNTPELVGTASMYRGNDQWAIFPDLLIRVRVLHFLDPRYVEAYLSTPSVRFYFQRAAQGIAGSMPKISQPVVEGLDVPLPPLPEQTRLVDALDLYTSRLDDAVATLERVQRNLKRYRASVLKAAVEGRLVPTEAELARKEGRDYESADVLLARILKERKARWIEQEAEKARASAQAKAKKAGKPWTKADDKAALDTARATAAKKYKEPESPDTSDLPALPEGWCWASMNQIANQRLGKMLDKAKNKGTLRPYLRNASVRWFAFDTSDISEMRVTDDEFAEVSVVAGDLIICEGGEPGRCAVWKDKAQSIAIQKALHRIRPYDGTLSDYLAYVFGADAKNGRLERAFTGSTIKHFTGEALRSYPVPLPPTEEQARIVEGIEHALSLETAISAEMTTAERRCGRLRQSILKWAFEGRLVDQDPNDEPASMLLERIKAEREAALAGAKTKGKPERKTRKKKPK